MHALLHGSKFSVIEHGLIHFSTSIICSERNQLYIILHRFIRVHFTSAKQTDHAFHVISQLPQSRAASYCKYSRRPTSFLSSINRSIYPNISIVYTCDISISCMPRYWLWELFISVILSLNCASLYIIQELTYSPPSRRGSILQTN